MQPDKTNALILWFDQLTIHDIPYVGGKNASLGEMYQKLVPHGVKVPNGFALTAHAYRRFIKENELDQRIKDALKGLDTHDVKDLKKRGKKIRDMILAAEFPKDIGEAVHQAYRDLSNAYHQRNADVAVRSSATAEDLPDASFAGQQESYLNIQGERQLLDTCRKCIASLFTDRAISYRVDKKFSHFKVALSVTVQKMVRSDLATSGVMFTIDTESGFRDVVMINASYGLGENIVKGKVNPDEFYVFKPTGAIISRMLGNKDNKLVYSKSKSHATKNLRVPKKERRQFCLSDKEVLQLAKWGQQIEKHYSKPMDIEWAKDGRDGHLYIVQARPETVESQENVNVLKEYKLRSKSKVILTGQSIGDKIGAGTVRLIKSIKEIDKFKPGDVLVTKITDPDWEPLMKMASAIITDTGGRTCHAAIVSRELGIPCIVGTRKGTKTLKDNQEVTVSCAEGEEGKIYKGILPFRIKKTNLKELKKPPVKIMLIIANPEMAFKESFLPTQGVGLAREEFIFSNYIKVHPLALLNYDQIKVKSVKNQIDDLTMGYKSREEFFVERLSSGIGRIAAAFYPQEVIVRTTDFKSNEYANLIGGKDFEPHEENPMIGWRGASRYYDPVYQKAFALECKALKRVREEMGLDNLTIMIPFCRTIKEGEQVLDLMAKNGLKRGEKGLKVYVMCEIPSNVILAEEFAQIFDGFSIGSNDLTQLTLGVDRDSSLVAHIFDENNEAVKELVRQVIKKAHKHKRYVGICGQAPSDYPDFAKFLADEGIDSIALNADAVIKTIQHF